MSGILALLIATAATIILTTSNLALADWKATFQQTPQIATHSASSSGTAATMTFNKIGSGSSSSSIYASSSTVKDPYEHITSNNIDPLQQFGTIRENPLASRTNTNNVDAGTYTTTTTGNTGSIPTTRTIQPMTTTSEPSHAQQQQQNPTSEVVTPQGPSQVTTVTLSLGGQMTCKPTELLRNSKCSPQPSCGPIGISQDNKCTTRPLYYHRLLISIR